MTRLAFSILAGAKNIQNNFFRNLQEILKPVRVENTSLRTGALRI